MGHIYAVVVFYDSSANGHAVALCYVLRGEIGIADDRVNGIQTQNMKRILFAGDRRFRGVTLVPVRALEQISHFRNPFAVDVLHRDAALPDDLAAFL